MAAEAYFPWWRGAEPRSRERVQRRPDPATEGPDPAAAGLGWPDQAETGPEQPDPAGPAVGDA